MIIINNTANYILDVDASKVIEYIRATGVVITPTMQHYAHYLVSNMKNIGTWQNSVAVYGMLGGTADSHALNWKDCRNLDAAFRLSFFNSPNHSSDGIQFNGTTQYANSFINPSTALAYQNNGVGIYVKAIGTSSSSSPYIFGASNLGSGFTGFRMSLRRTNLGGGINTDFFISDGSSNDVARYDAPNTTFRLGYYQGNFSSGNISINYNGENITNLLLNTGTATSLVNLNIFLGAENSNGAVSSYSNNQVSFFRVSSGLSSTQLSQEAHHVRISQSILNRA